jgi:hypothetical protein
MAPRLLATTVLMALAGTVFGCGQPPGRSDSALDAGTDGGATVDAGFCPTPTAHRPTAEACTQSRPPGNAMNVMGQCRSDAECQVDGGVNGRCSDNVFMNICTWDQCLDDTQCGFDGVCVCRSSYDFGANICGVSNCHVDSDCAPCGFCSPSVGGQCWPNVGVNGYFCHTPADECTNDSDCVGGDLGEYCSFRADAGRWQCISIQCEE